MLEHDMTTDYVPEIIAGLDFDHLGSHWLDPRRLIVHPEALRERTVATGSWPASSGVTASSRSGIGTATCKRCSSKAGPATTLSGKCSGATSAALRHIGLLPRQRNAVRSRGAVGPEACAVFPDWASLSSR